MSTAALAKRSRASFVLRLLYGECESVALSPAVCRGLRGWFTGLRIVRETHRNGLCLLRVARSPWPTIATRVALLLVMLAAGLTFGGARAVLVAVAVYAFGVFDARLRH